MADAGIPTRFPIFPLPNLVLFPDVKLPLHIFEPRYRQMTSDTLAGERVIGMTLLRPPVASDQGRSPVYEVGCAGRISQCVELPDGRYNLLLDGECRFRILREVDLGTPYRVIDAELCPEPELDAHSGHGIDDLRERIEVRVRELLRDAAPRAAELFESRARSLGPRELVHMLAFGLDLSVVEKQTLLEASDPLRRAGLLLELLEMRRAERRLPDAPHSIN